MKLLRNIGISILFLILVGSVQAGTIHVPGDYPTIQAGIDAASDGDTVVVADGIYTGEGNANMDFGGKAITVRSENGPANCIIGCGCGEDTRAFYFHNDEGPDSVVKGFTIRGGKAIDVLVVKPNGLVAYEVELQNTNHILENIRRDIAVGVKDVVIVTTQELHDTIKQKVMKQFCNDRVSLEIIDRYLD